MAALVIQFGSLWGTVFTGNIEGSLTGLEPFENISTQAKEDLQIFPKQSPGDIHSTLMHHINIDATAY